MFMCLLVTSGSVHSVPGDRSLVGDPLSCGYPLLYSDLENSMDCIVHRVAESLTQLSNFDFHATFLSCTRTLITDLREMTFSPIRKEFPFFFFYKRSRMMLFLN